MHRRTIAVTLILAGVCLSACAQRGGSHSGPSGHGVGFANHGTPDFHASSTFAGRAGFMVGPRFTASRYAALNSSQRFIVRPTQAGYAGQRSVNEHENRGGRYRRPYLPFYAVGLPYGAGWIDPSYLGYGDPGFYDNSITTASQSPEDPTAADYEPASSEQIDPAPPNAYRPSYRKPEPAPDPEPESAVTLVFKDGRPNQQIRNYMLTRTTLYIQDQRLQEIPVDQLDLAATERLNQDAGVEFQLPGTSR